MAIIKGNLVSIQYNGQDLGVGKVSSDPVELDANKFLGPAFDEHLGRCFSVDVEIKARTLDEKLAWLDLFNTGLDATVN